MRVKRGSMELILIQVVMLSSIVSAFLATPSASVTEENLTRFLPAEPEEWSEFASADDDSAELIIGVSGKHPNSHAKLSSFITQWGGELVDTIRGDGEIQAIVVGVPSGAMSSFVTRVQATGLSTYVEPNVNVWALWEPNDPNWDVQWGLKKIEANYAWNTTKGSRDVLVAVIDTGIDYNHEDLHDNYAFDVQDRPLGYDWVNNDADPMDDRGHGTHCAGIIAAVINNSKGIAGVANVTIVAEKVLDEYGYGETDDVANGIYHAVDQLGANVLSLSLGGYLDSVTLHEAIRHAYDNNILVIAAAGNDEWSRKLYPAAYDEVVAVVATDRDDDPAYFTNFGDWVEVAAPGVDIFSTTLYNSYGSKSGTSMACPHVAGVAALTWSQFPSVSRDWLRRRLRLTAVDLNASGFDIYYGYGRINASGAVNEAVPAHDLLVYDWKLPPAVEPGDDVTSNTTVLNFGESIEENVYVKLLVNGTEMDSKNIATLSGGESARISCSWTPTAEGKYNVTTQIAPKDGESDVENNVQSAYVCVNDEGAVRVPQDFLTIEKAVNTTNKRMYSGDAVIRVASGTYNEEGLVIDNLLTSLTLLGENWANTIVNGSAGSVGMSVKSNDVTATGFTIQNFDKAIVLESILATVRDNAITNNVDGVYLDVFSHDNSVTNNTITNNTENGIHAYCSIDNTFSSNSLYYNRYGVYLEGVLSIRNPRPGPHSASDANLESSFIKFFISGNTVSNNTISHNSGHGIYLWHAETNFIIGNTLSNNCGNIVLDDANYNLISDNTVLDCIYWGISLFESFYNTIDGNYVSNTTSGVDLMYLAGDNYVVRNTILHNDRAGIEIGKYCRFNYIVGNTISKNDFGVLSSFGPFNYIHHNNFVDNTNQGSSGPEPYKNVWDNGYPSGGNYWSDYNGTDADGDGIGDTPYTVDPDENDYYPLMDQVGLVFRVPEDYATIQEAINAVPSGATILIASGTYYEQITVNKKLTILGKSSSYTIIDGNGALEVIRVTASDVTIKGFTVQNGYRGVNVFHSSRTVIAINLIRYNRLGVDVDIYSSSCTIKDNTISNNNQTGVAVDGDFCTVANNVISETTGVASSSGLLLGPDSNYNIVANNTILNNLWGIYVAWQSQYNTISDNLISFNSYGIRLDQALDNTLNNNDITSNTEYGIAITDCTSANQISNNVISNNNRGIYLNHADNQIITYNTISNNQFGIKSSHSDDNIVHHNNFIDNSNQAQCTNSVNIWDDSSEGNYWSDYTGEDLDGDGIGDTPYIIDRKNKDNYPLMNPVNP